MLHNVQSKLYATTVAAEHRKKEKFDPSKNIESLRTKTVDKRAFPEVKSKLFTPTKAYIHGSRDKADRMDPREIGWNMHNSRDSNDDSFLVDERADGNPRLYTSKSKFRDVPSKLLSPTKVLLLSCRNKADCTDSRESGWNATHCAPENARSEILFQRRHSYDHSFDHVKSKLLQPTQSLIYGSKEKVPIFPRSTNKPFESTYMQLEKTFFSDLDHDEDEECTGMPILYTDVESRRAVPSKLLEPTRAVLLKAREKKSSLGIDTWSVSRMSQRSSIGDATVSDENVTDKDELNDHSLRHLSKKFAHISSKLFEPTISALNKSREKAVATDLRESNWGQKHSMRGSILCHLSGSECTYDTTSDNSTSSCRPHSEAVMNIETENPRDEVVTNPDGENGDNEDKDKAVPADGVQNINKLNRKEAVFASEPLESTISVSHVLLAQETHSKSQVLSLRRNRSASDLPDWQRCKLHRQNFSQSDQWVAELGTDVTDGDVSRVRNHSESEQVQATLNTPISDYSTSISEQVENENTFVVEVLNQTEICSKLKKIDLHESLPKDLGSSAAEESISSIDLSAAEFSGDNGKEISVPSTDISTSIAAPRIDQHESVSSQLDRQEHSQEEVTRADLVQHQSANNVAQSTNDVTQSANNVTQSANDVTQSAIDVTQSANNVTQSTKYVSQTATLDDSIEATLEEACNTSLAADINHIDDLFAYYLEGRVQRDVLKSIAVGKLGQSPSSNS